MPVKLVKLHTSALCIDLSRAERGFLDYEVLLKTSQTGPIYKTFNLHGTISLEVVPLNGSILLPMLFSLSEGSLEVLSLKCVTLDLVEGFKMSTLKI